MKKIDIFCRRLVKATVLNWTHQLRNHLSINFILSVFGDQSINFRFDQLDSDVFFARTQQNSRNLWSTRYLGLTTGEVLSRCWNLGAEGRNRDNFFAKRNQHRPLSREHKRGGRELTRAKRGPCRFIFGWNWSSRLITVRWHFTSKVRTKTNLPWIVL